MEIINSNGDFTILHSTEFDPAPMLAALPTKPLETPTQAYDVLGDMREAAVESGFDHFEPFLRGYLLVTGIVIRDLKDRLFDDPDSVERAIPDFAQRCVEPTRQFLLRNYAAVPPQWNRTLDPAAVRRARPLIQFAGGYISHIDRDLPFTVAALGAPESYRPDYNDHIRLNIAEAADELAREYMPVSSSVRDPIVEHMLGRIARMRERAWKNGGRLIAAQDDPDNLTRIEKELDRISTSRGLIYRYPGNWALGALEIFAPAREEELAQAG